MKTKFVSFKGRDEVSYHCLSEIGNEASVPMMAVFLLGTTSCPSLQGTGDHGSSTARKKGV